MGLNILAWAKAKKYTDNAVSQASGLHREIVNSLPATGDEHVIYMVPKTGSGNDNYDEYMWINGSYEFIGSTAVDLTDYYNKTQVDTALSGKANKATTLSGYGITDAYTKTQVDNLLTGTLDTTSPPETVYSDELPFVTPSDGYIQLSVGSGETGYVYSDGVALLRVVKAPCIMNLSCFVKKGVSITLIGEGNNESIDWIPYD